MTAVRRKSTVSFIALRNRTRTTALNAEAVLKLWQRQQMQHGPHQPGISARTMTEAELDKRPGGLRTELGFVRRQFGGARRQDRHLAGPQRHGQDDDGPGYHGACCAAPGLAFDGEPIDAATPEDMFDKFIKALCTGGWRLTRAAQCRAPRLLPLPRIRRCAARRRVS